MDEIEPMKSFASTVEPTQAVPIKSETTVEMLQLSIAAPPSMAATEEPIQAVPVKSEATVETMEMFVAAPPSMAATEEPIQAVPVKSEATVQTLEMSVATPPSMAATEEPIQAVPVKSEATVQTLEMEPMVTEIACKDCTIGITECPPIAVDMQELDNANFETIEMHIESFVQPPILYDLVIISIHPNRFLSSQQARSILSCIEANHATIISIDEKYVSVRASDESVVGFLLRGDDKSKFDKSYTKAGSRNGNLL
jgi:hypothetical protein